MSLKKSVRFKGTLALKLTLWYSVLYSASVLAAFTIIYILIHNLVYKHRDHSLAAEIKEFTMIQADGGLEKVDAGIHWEVGSEGADQIFLRILSLEGAELLRSDMTAWKGLPPADRSVERLLAGGADHVFETLRLSGQSHPVRVISGHIGNGLILQFGQSLEEDESFLEILRDVFIPLMFGATLLAAVCGWFMAKRALSGVEEVTRTALEISKGAFERRVTVNKQEAEVTLLASAFNTMLERINTLFCEMKEMNNNIAHDLRTPLARIRGAAEMALTGDVSVEESKLAAAEMIEECDRLMGVINTMLDIAEAEAGLDGPKRRPVDMTRVILNACNLFMPVAEEKGIDLTNSSAGQCVVMADERMLQRLVSNLIDNALKYTPTGGKIAISASTQDEHVMVRLQDSGVGISSKDMPFIFDKFYRCDRSRAAYGSGLGLSLSKAIVASHGGAIKVDSRIGEGTTFTVRLPRAGESENLEVATKKSLGAEIKAGVRIKPKE